MKIYFHIKHFPQCVQYYIKSGRHRYVDLGLRTHRMKCSVHEDFKYSQIFVIDYFDKIFRLILIAEKKKVNQDFPTPLVNRLEKHFINNETVLEGWQKAIVDDIEKWLTSFVTDDGYMNTICLLCIIFVTDSRKKMLLLGTILIPKQLLSYKLVPNFIRLKIFPRKRKWYKKHYLIYNFHKMCMQVLQLSKKLLLQMATPDAVVRALEKDTKDGQMFLKQVYFIEQEHSSLVALLQRILLCNENTFLLQVCRPMLTGKIPRTPNNIRPQKVE